MSSQSQCVPLRSSSFQINNERCFVQINLWGLSTEQISKRNINIVEIMKNLGFSSCLVLDVPGDGEKSSRFNANASEIFSRESSRSRSRSLFSFPPNIFSSQNRSRTTSNETSHGYIQVNLYRTSLENISRRRIDLTGILKNFGFSCCSIFEVPLDTSLVSCGANDVECVGAAVVDNGVQIKPEALTSSMVQEQPSYSYRFGRPQERSCESRDDFVGFSFSSVPRRVPVSIRKPPVPIRSSTMVANCEERAANHPLATADLTVIMPPLEVEPNVVEEEIVTSTLNAREESPPKQRDGFNGVVEEKNCSNTATTVHRTNKGEHNIEEGEIRDHVDVEEFVDCVSNCTNFGLSMLQRPSTPFTPTIERNDQALKRLLRSDETEDYKSVKKSKVGEDEKYPSGGPEGPCNALAPTDLCGPATSIFSNLVHGLAAYCVDALPLNAVIHCAIPGCSFQKDSTECNGRSELLRHVCTIHFAGSNRKCPFCPVFFSNFKDSAEHHKNVHPDMPFTMGPKHMIKLTDFPILKTLWNLCFPGIDLTVWNCALAFKRINERFENKSKSTTCACGTGTCVRCLLTLEFLEELVPEKNSMNAFMRKLPVPTLHFSQFNATFRCEFEGCNTVLNYQKSQGPRKMAEHVMTHANSSEDFNCIFCPFKGSTKKKLNRHHHMVHNLKHFSWPDTVITDDVRQHVENWWTKCFPGFTVIPTGE